MPFYLQSLVSEITAGRARTIVVTLHETYWSIGVILLPAVAGLLNWWALMYVAISTPTLILVFLHRFGFCFNSSPSNLLSQIDLIDTFQVDTRRPSVVIST